MGQPLVFLPRGKPSPLGVSLANLPVLFQTLGILVQHCMCGEKGTADGWFCVNHGLTAGPKASHYPPSVSLMGGAGGGGGGIVTCEC